MVEKVGRGYLALPPSPFLALDMWHTNLDAFEKIE